MDFRTYNRSISQMNTHKIICDDCIKQLKQFEDNSIDSCVTDPPYGLDFMGKDWDSFNALSFQHFTYQWAAELYRILKPGAHILVFGGTRTYHRMACAVEDTGFEVRDMIEWFYCSVCKRSDQIKNMGKHLHNAPNRTRYNHIETHPTQKPLQLIQYLIKLITPINGTTIDPFLGSGTGLIAAEREQLNCIGVDTNQAYCNISHQRFKDEVKQTKLSGQKSNVTFISK